MLSVQLTKWLQALNLAPWIAQGKVETFRWFRDNK